jgi:hypothetical protein
MKLARIFFGSLVMIGLLGCSHVQPGQEAPSRSLNEALVRMARDYLQREQPAWFEEAAPLPPMVIDHADYWEVTFQLPRNTAGGTPVVDISKKLLTVVGARHGQ